MYLNYIEIDSTDSMLRVFNPVKILFKQYLKCRCGAIPKFARKVKAPIWGFCHQSKNNKGNHSFIFVVCPLLFSIIRTLKFIKTLKINFLRVLLFVVTILGYLLHEKFLIFLISRALFYFF